MIIGLTGKICAGKDTLASMLPHDRFSVIDVDGLGHEALSENISAIRHAFGDSVIKADGSVDRKVLGPMVFADKEKLETLNSITHPWMVERALGMARDADGAVVVLQQQVDEHHDAQAMWLLGLCCEYGLGTDQDTQRAEQLFQQAAQHGD